MWIDMALILFSRNQFQNTQHLTTPMCETKVIEKEERVDQGRAKMSEKGNHVMKLKPPPDLTTCREGTRMKTPRRKTTKPQDGIGKSSLKCNFKGQSNIKCFLEQKVKAIEPPSFQNSTTNTSQENQNTRRIPWADFIQNFTGKKTTQAEKIIEQSPDQMREGREFQN